MKSNLRLYFVSAALLAATAAHAESASVGVYSAQESATRQESAKLETKPGDLGDHGSAGSGSGEPQGSPSSEEYGSSGSTVRMIAPDPSDPFVQQIWTAP